MVDFILHAQPFLGYFEQTYEHTKLREIFDVGIVSLAIPLGEIIIAKRAFKSEFGADIPNIGVSFLSKEENIRIVRLSIDQALMILPRSLHKTGAAHYVSSFLKEVFYITEQSDVWVMLELSGKGARQALERICPIDLAPNVFEVNAVARTSMDHMGTVVIRNDEDSFLLMSASSSANSFLKTVKKSIKNTT